VVRRQHTEPLTKLKEVAEHLRSTGAPAGFAETVESVMTVEGNRALARAIMAQRELDGEIGQNLAINMPLAVREEIKANVAKAQRENPDRDPKKAITATSEAAKALNAFLAGEFIPTRQPRAARGTAEETGNLNVRVDPALRQRAEDFGADHASEFGWAPRASHIISGWLVQKFTEAGKTAPAE
jgi:hypothetical protein